MPRGALGVQVGRLVRPAEPVLKGMAIAEASMIGGAWAVGQLTPGFTVIGNYESYIHTANALGAHYYDLGAFAWRVAPGAVTALNTAYVSFRALVGDTFVVQYNLDNYSRYAGAGLQLEQGIIDMMGLIARGGGRYYMVP